MMAAILVLVVVLFALIVWYMRDHYSYWSKQGLSTDLGFFFNFINKTFPEADMKAVSKHGKIFGYFNIFTPALFIADYELAKKVQSTEFHNFANHMPISRRDDYNGESVFSLDDAEWRHMRSIITPSFTSGKLRKMHPLIGESVKDTIENMRTMRDPKTGELGMHHIFSGFTLDVIASCAFGTKLNSARDPENQFARFGRLFSDKLTVKQIVDILLILAFPRFSLDVLGLNGFKRKPSLFFSDVTKRIVNQRRQDGGQQREDFIKFLMEATDGQGQPMTDKQIADNGILFFIAGHDTSSVTLTHVIYHLAIHPDIQDQLVAEVDRFLLDNEGQEITYDKMKALVYTEAVILETLRTTPTVPRIFRAASQDCDLEGVKLKKGMHVIISNYVIHHDEENFERAQEFLPTRWLPDTPLRHNSQAFMAFSMGPRNCIGIRFAMYEMKLMVLAMMQHFRFERTINTQVPVQHLPGGLLIPKSSIVRVVDRNSSSRK